ncbi:CRTC2 protein, partial [Polyodon spathula]|nr:CRTC2 protein [Polyodon spathula]
SNPRKFSEKIALHNQRQAEETAAFQEVMMGITSTRVGRRECGWLQAQKVRLARCQGTYYGGSLPNVNQIGNSTSEFQGPFHLNLDSARGARHHGLLERVPRERPVVPVPALPLTAVIQIDSSPYSSAYLSPPPDTTWRRTNSDSALHTSVMNPTVQDSFNCGPGLAPQNRRSATEALEHEEVMQPLLLFSIFPSPEQHSSSALVPSALNTGGSLPDLTNLHFPSPLPTPLDPDEPPFPSLSGGSSTGNLASTLTQLGFGVEPAFHSQGPSSLQGSFSNPSLQSSLSNPNIQSSLGSLAFQTSFSNPSLQSSSLKSSSLQSSPSNQSLQSSLSNASLLSSVSNSSLGSLSIQSTGSNPSYSSGVGSSSSSSSYSPMMMQSQQQPPAESSLLSSLLDDPYLGLQLTARQTQALSQQMEQFNMESHAGSLSLSNNSSGGGGFPGELQGQAFSPLESGKHSNLQDPQLLNKQRQSYTGGRHGNVPSIILTGDSPPGLSKEIASALAGVPGFEFGQFSLDDALRMEPLALEGLGMLGEADLVLPDPSVEDSFRSDRLK